MKAIDVEDFLHWAYARENADGAGAEEREHAWLEASTGNAAVCLRRGLLGCQIDGGGVIPSGVHPDAQAGHDALIVVCRGMGVSAGWIIGLCKAGTRPDWGEDARFRPEPRRWKVPGDPSKGAEVVTDRDYYPNTRRVRAEWSYCEIVWADSPEYVAQKRAAYQDWWRVIAAVGANLFGGGGLVDHVISGPRAPSAPWQPRETPASLRNLACAVPPTAIYG